MTKKKVDYVHFTSVPEICIFGLNGKEGLINNITGKIISENFYCHIFSDGRYYKIIDGEKIWGVLDLKTGKKIENFDVSGINEKTIIVDSKIKCMDKFNI